MGMFVDISGMRFGCLKAKSFGPSPKGKNMWLCECECGNYKYFTRQALQKMKSCGCKRDAVISAGSRKVHGMSYTPTYKTWDSMKDRCRNPNNESWERYGGRGIKVCDRWMKFENFIIDMGCKPDGLTIDRIDNNGNYEPGNCKWSSPVEQANNTRSNRVINYKGRKWTTRQLSDECGISYRLLRHRLFVANWDIESAVSKVARPKKTN